MSLATRCPACGTVFRVVQDQLRVSEGWVRCGRCSEVFNGTDQLVDLGAPTVPVDAEAAATARVGDPDIVVDDGRVHAPQSEAAAPFESASPIDDPESMSAPPQAVDAPVADAGGRLEPSLDTGLLAAEEATPSFLQAAERSQRRQRPALRLALATLAVLASVVLLLQAAMEYRDLTAARWPEARPALEALCRWSGCRIEPPRWIEALVVDSSGLVRVEGTNTYRFVVVLRNRAAMGLAMPSVDLVLTDTQGRVIARRALSAADLGSSVVVVPPMAELPLQATLAVAERPVAGYTIEIFYP
jgi:predicted Zn finger-like uncharacterized protein